MWSFFSKKETKPEIIELKFIHEKEIFNSMSNAEMCFFVSYLMREQGPLYTTEEEWKKLKDFLPCIDRFFEKI